MYKIVYNVPAEVFLNDAAELLHAHWKELAVNQDKVFLKPDVNKYVLLQENGMLHNLVAYDNNKVIGYSVIIIQPHIHYVDTIFAAVDVIYVDKKYRNNNIGARLLIATERLAKEKGVHVITHHAKPNVPMIVKPLQKMGYTLYEQMYGKYVGE